MQGVQERADGAGAYLHQIDVLGVTHGRQYVELVECRSAAKRESFRHVGI